MGSQKKKLLVLVPLFVFWVAADLGTKHWADISLADSRHPLVIEVTADQSGQPAGEVVANFLGTTVDSLGDTLPHIALLPPNAALSPGDNVYDQAGPLGDATNEAVNPPGP